MKTLPLRLFRKQDQSLVITPFDLRKTVLVMLPFYKKIARDAEYAERFSQDVRTANLTHMIQLFRQVVPRPKNIGFSVNSIGYFIDIPVPKPVEFYTSSIAIPTGLGAQFHFNTRAHRAVAAAILPLYRAIFCSKLLASTILEAVRRKNLAKLNRIVRTFVKSPFLRKIKFATLGFSMRFKFPFDKFPYDNSLFFSLPM